MLNVFRGRIPFPSYRVFAPTNGDLQRIVVKEEVRSSKFFFRGFLVTEVDNRP